MGKHDTNHTNIRERRILPIDGMEIREVGEGDSGSKKIVGYVAEFNKWSEDLGGFVEQISPGAFRGTIKTDDIRGLFNHNPDYVLGRNTAGTLALKEDKRGLFVEIDPPDAQWARDRMVSIARGDITGQSFGFETLRQEWDESDPKIVRRTLHEVKLFDVGPVTFPAYPQTSVQVRSLEHTLSIAGVDIQTLNRALIKMDNELTLTQDDRWAIDEVIQVLQSAITIPPSGGDPDILRRKLELKLSEGGVA